MNPVNLWSVLVAAVAAFVIGAMWYSPILFGKRWMELKGISEKDVTESSKQGMWRRYVAQFISTAVMFVVLGFFIANASVASAGEGALLALIAWVGFSLTAAVGDMLWNKSPLMLAVITEACALISWLVGGAIIGAWR